MARVEGHILLALDLLKYVKYDVSMKELRIARERRGLSQRELARRAGLSFRGVQLIERPGHDPRISSLGQISGALGLPSEGMATLAAGFFLEDGGSFRTASIRMLVDGFDSWMIHLFDAVDAFRRVPDIGLVRSAPAEEIDPGLRALIASTVETLCDEAELGSPGWCRGIEPLKYPWFVAGVENLKASALIESPVRYRKRNLFVLGNFLTRA